MQKKEEIRREYENYIDAYMAKINLWENVKRVTKKDGTDFQNFSKNFENARIEKGRISGGDVEIVVSGWGNNGVYIEDRINTRQVVQYSKVAPDESQIINVHFLAPYFYMTPAQTMEYIKLEIEGYKSRVLEYESYIEKLDTIYDYVVNDINNLMQYVRENAGKNTSLYYSMRKLIQDVGY